MNLLSFFLDLCLYILNQIKKKKFEIKFHKNREYNYKHYYRIIKNKN